MFKQISRFVCGATCGALLAAAIGAGAAQAQNYPARPISIVVPYPAGGVTDNIVRLLAEGMKILG